MPTTAPANPKALEVMFTVASAAKLPEGHGDALCEVLPSLPRDGPNG